MSQVKVITVAGLRFLTERGRESASGAFWRRGAGDYCGPAPLLRRTGDTITFDRRRIKEKRTVFNFFLYRSTNAQAEALNTKIKAFRAQLRGIVDLMRESFNCLQLVPTEKTR